MSAAAELARRSRLALRLPAQSPGLRPRTVHNRRRPVPVVDAVQDEEPAAPTTATDGVVRRMLSAVDPSQLRADALAAARRMLGAVDPSQLRADALAAARRMLSAVDPSQLRADALATARRMSAASLPMLRRFVTLALVAVAMMAPLAMIGATALRSAVHTVTQDPQAGMQATWAAAAVRNDVAAPEPVGLRVHVQKQAFLHAGGERQFRLAVDGDSGYDGSGDATNGSPLLLVDLAIHQDRSGEGAVTVTPTQLVVSRSELRLTPIWIQVAAAASCGSDLGELHVRVRDLATDGSHATTTITLPPVDCRAEPLVLGERR
jgi:hypothetical protein